MDEKLRASLGRLKQRYFFKSFKYPNGAIGHLTGCLIRGPKEKYGFVACTCGLLGDFEWIQGNFIAEKLYPPTYKESRLQYTQSTEPQSEEEKAKCIQILQKAFPGYQPITPEDKALLDEEDWEVITEVFGRDWVDEWRALDHGDDD